MSAHWYYLHTNGDLIHKNYLPDPSDFTVKTWRLDLEDRCSAWNILLDALSLGADRERVKELAKKWRCTAEDFTQFLSRNPIPMPGQDAQAKKFFAEILGLDMNSWCKWLAKTPKGSEPDYHDARAGQLVRGEAMNIIYHNNCADGFGAAYAAWLIYHDEARYWPAQYGSDQSYMRNQVSANDGPEKAGGPKDAE